MLQRAASNAYSWWWASHIRAKQGKWLDQNLQDMEEKVKSILIIIEEDADSFAKRAEMFYKKRPELINFVEEYYKAYRSLIDRYGHIARELQNANETIATAFPNQVQFPMEGDDDDEQLPKASPLNSSETPKALPENLKFNLESSVQSKDAKKPSLSLQENSQARKAGPQKNKVESQEQINKVQKWILVLQTEMESVQNSYESELAKYWEIEEQITGMQEKICRLQDEFSVSTVIEDDEARSLVAVTALRSCEDTLLQLQKQQKRSTEETRVDSQKVIDIEKKLKVLKNQFLRHLTENMATDEATTIEDPTTTNPEEEVYSIKQQKLEFQSICEKVKQYFEMNYNTPLTVTDLAENIDKLVNMVLGLETTVSSQTTLIKRLRLETDRLQNHLQCLEQDKKSLIDDSNDLNEKIRELENELHEVQDLNQSVKEQNNILQMGFTDVCQNLEDLSEKLQSSEKQDVVEIMDMEENFHEVQDLNQSVKDQNNILQMGFTDVCQNLEDLSEKMQSSEKQDVVEIMDMEENFHEVQDLNQSVKDQNNILQMGFTDVCQNLEDLSDKVQSSEKQDVVEIMDMEENDFLHAEPSEQCQEQEVMTTLANETRDSEEKMTELSNETKGIKDPNLCVEDEENHIQSESCGNLGALSENLQDPKNQDEVENTLPSQGEDTVLLNDEDSPNWQQLFVNGTEDREKILLTEYTSVLRNYKETKIRLTEIQNKKKDTFFETMTQVRELKSASAMKDMEIHSLRQKLSILQTSPDENFHHSRVVSIEGIANSGADNFQAKSLDGPNSNLLENQGKEGNNDSIERMDESNQISSIETPAQEINVALTGEQHTPSSIEEKFRKDIDELLEENLQFWMRFSTSSQQIQKFRTEAEDLQTRFLKLTTNSSDPSAKSEATPVIKRLNELQTELSEWLEQNALLKDELQYRLSSLCKIQEEISRVSKLCYETEQTEFTAYEATKFQGEVLNMQQENNKVENDLQVCLDHVRGLQLGVEKTLSKLQGNSRESGSKNHQPNHKVTNPSRVSLQSFIYGVKPKKQSKFSFMNPALQKQFRDLKAGLPK